jgi:hypothetical protein
MGLNYFRLGYTLPRVGLYAKINSSIATQLHNWQLNYFGLAHTLNPRKSQEKGSGTRKRIGQAWPRLNYYIQKARGLPQHAQYLAHNHVMHE